MAFFGNLQLITDSLFFKRIPRFDANVLNQYGFLTRTRQPSNSDLILFTYVHTSINIKSYIREQDRHECYYCTVWYNTTSYYYLPIDTIPDRSGNVQTSCCAPSRDVAYRLFFPGGDILWAHSTDRARPPSLLSRGLHRAAYRLFQI